MRTVGVWTGGLLVFAALALAIGVGPASAADAGTSGTSGGVAWKVVGVIQTRLPEERALRWDYTVVLTGARSIRFEQIVVNGSPRKFEGRLDAGGELRVQHWDRARSGDSRMVARRQYTGKDDAGNPVSVEARFDLDATIGQRSVSTSAVTVASPTDGVPLPSDSRIVPPAATAPRELAGFSGVWVGKWNGVGSHVLVVEEVGERDALVSYAWGGTPTSPQPGWIRARAQFRDGRLALTSLSQATVTYEAQPDGRLLGVWTLGNQISMVRLSREPAGLVQSAAASAAPAGRARLLGREAWQDLLDGRYADALPKAQQALALSEQQFGPDHLEVAASLNTLGEVYRAYGRFDDAERVHRRALGIREKQLGPADPAVATTLNNLAMLHNARAVYTEAESLLKRALVITERAQETSQQDRRLQAEILENLAKVYRALGRIAEAEEAQGKAMMLWTMQ